LRNIIIKQSNSSPEKKKNTAFLKGLKYGGSSREVFDEPLIGIGKEAGASDGLMVTNPAITPRPEGGHLMIFKAAAVDSRS
jgi:hypothetical protein